MESFTSRSTFQPLFSLALEVSKGSLRPIGGARRMCLDGCLLTIEGRKPVEGLDIPSGLFQKEPESGTETWSRDDSM